jgi:Protein of unknown function (DUF4019)
MMSMRSILVAGCLTTFLVAGLGIAAEKPEDAAQAAAESWMRLVDGGNYAASWEQAAKALKRVVKQPEWEQTAGGVRAPLGKVVSRKLKSREYTENMPTTRVIGGRVYSWGTGKYVVIQYDTVFANKASAVETVIPMADPDGVWRVSAYSVR